MRLLPYSFTRWAIHFINEHEKHPICVYFHPWEVDPEQPRMSGSFTARVRHYAGLNSMQPKLHMLLRDFEFAPLGGIVRQLRPKSSVASGARQPYQLLLRSPGVSNLED